MCLAIPMRIIEVENDQTGTVDVDGVKQEVNISLIEDPKVDDFVIVHAGFAIEKLDEEEAAKTLEVFQELAEQNALS